MGLMMMLQGTTAVAEIASAAFLNQIKRSLRFLCRRKKGMGSKHLAKS
jgi:hypothetical protein